MQRQLIQSLGVFLLLAGFVTQGWAQEKQEPGNGGDEASSQRFKQLAKDSEELLDENVKKLSGQEKLKKAQSKIESSKKTLEKTQKLLDKLKSEEKDIVKINRVSEKLAAIKGFLKVAEQSYVELKKAVESGDKSEANHRYTLIAVSAQRIKKLGKEAERSVGSVERYAEGTKVERTVDKNVVDEPEYLTQETPAQIEDIGTLPELTPLQ